MDGVRGNTTIVQWLSHDYVSETVKHMTTRNSVQINDTKLPLATLLFVWFHEQTPRTQASGAVISQSVPKSCVTTASMGCVVTSGSRTRHHAGTNLMHDDVTGREEEPGDVSKIGRGAWGYHCSLFC